MELYKITSNDIKCNLINLNQIVFEVTNACNFRCEYCIYSGMYKGYSQLSTQFLSFGRVKIMLDYLLKLWVENQRPVTKQPIFIGFFGGEPLLNFSLVKQIVQYVESHIIDGRNIVYSMTTNAYLLSEYMDFLVEKDFQLLISLDGNRKQNSFRKTKTGMVSFDKVFANILKLKDMYPNYFRRKVNFNAVFNRFSNFTELSDFFMSNFGKIPFISELNNSMLEKGCEEKFGLIYQSKYKSFFNMTNKNELDDNLFLSSPRVKLLSDFIFNHTDNVYSTYNELFTNKENMKIIPTGTCVPFQKKIFVTATGKILQCEKIGHEHTLGHVTENKVELNLEEIVNKFNNLVGKFYDQCKKCAINYSCSVCMLQKYSTKIENAMCSNFYTPSKYTEYVKKNMESLKDNPTLYEKILKDIVYY